MPGYASASDLDANYAVNVADRQLLAHNYGFVADSSAPTFPDYFAPGSGTVWMPGVGGASTPSSDGGSAQGGVEPASDPVLHPTQSASAPVVPTPDPIPLAPLTNPGFGITNGDFAVSQPDAAGFGWTERGQVAVAGGGATLLDGGTVSTALTQAFFIPAGVTTLRFTLDSVLLASAAGLPPDAFEVALLHAQTLQPLTQTVAGLGSTDALLNVQSDGSYFVSPQVTISNVSQNGGILGSTVPRFIELDISGIAANTLAVLSFDLLGFGATGSSVRISHVELADQTAATPIAVPDLATTAENQAVSIAVLGNDSSTTSTLDPTSVTIVVPPQHGTATVDTTTGQILYTPDLHYAGDDSFSYQVRDAGGLISNAAAVLVTMTAVADQPTLTVGPASGDQDTKIPLSIDAGVEQLNGPDNLYVDVSNLPVGSSLSAGVIVDVGTYRLTMAQLAGLTFTPQPGLAGTYTLTVTAVSTSVTSGDTASATASLPVTVNAVTPTPLTVTDFQVNQGAAQRSSINVLQVRFNQDVLIDDMPNDVRVTSIAGDVIEVPPERYSYDPTTFTLSVDVRGLIPQDGEYFLQIRGDAVAATNHRAVTLSTGSAFPFLDGFLPLLFYHLTADFDGNNFVDYADYNLWEAHNSSLAGDARYDAVYDLDSSGVIDRFDYAVWRQHLGTTTDTIAPATGALVVPAEGPNPFGGTTYKSDANLSLFAMDASGVYSATLQFDNAAPMNLLAHLDANGLLNMPLGDVAALAGGHADARRAHHHVERPRYLRQRAGSLRVVVLDQGRGPAGSFAAGHRVGRRHDAKRRRAQQQDADRQRDRRRREHHHAVPQRSRRAGRGRRGNGRAERAGEIPDRFEHARRRHLHVQRDGPGPGRQRQRQLANADVHAGQHAAGGRHLRIGGRFDRPRDERQHDHARRGPPGGPYRAGGQRDARGYRPNDQCRRFG